MNNIIKEFFNSLSFQVKLIIFIIFTLSVFLTISAFLIIQNIQTSIDKQVYLLSSNLKATQFLSNLVGQTLIVDYKTNEKRKAKLIEISDNFIKSHPEFACVVLTDNAGNILFKSKLSDLYGFTQANSTRIPPPRYLPQVKISYSNNGKLLAIAEPVQFSSNFLGWLHAGILDPGFTIVGSKKELLLFLLEIFLLVWVLLVIGAIFNSVIINRPLRKLEKSAKAIAEGRFGVQLPLRGFLGKELTQLVKVFNKMSKRLRQYEESNIAILSSERNKFESVVMSIADGVIVMDKENEIQIVNPAARNLLNRSGDELINQKITNIWDKKTSEQILSFLNVTQEYANFEIIRENKKLKILITPLYDSNNEQLGAVMVIQDRTKEAEVEQIKQEFISNVSHELRTPITSIKCYVDTLCSHGGGIDEKTKNDFLQIVNEEADRLTKLVNDVLELSKLETSTTKIELTLQDIYPSINYSFKSVVVLAEKKNIKLSKEVEKNLPSLMINQEYLERVLINLLGNAVKYTPANGMVKLIVKRNENEILFQVIDNGIGIEEEHIPLIFERFYRVENKVHTIKGTGLGLTIVRKSVEQHGGKLSVKSKLGEGSIFEFSLPIPLVDENISGQKEHEYAV